ncbi:MAG: RNA-binding cell elongation regulator Jag/EloR [Clostridia bacterium]
MIRTLEIKAASVDLAVEQALAELAVTRDQVEVEILAKGGLFSKASVRVTTIETVASKVADFMNGLLSRMNLNAKATVEDKGVSFYVNIEGEDSGVAIGYRGETLDAFQYLILTFLNQDKSEAKKVVVDSENYRAKREETLIALANRLAEKAVRTCRKVKLEPMNPLERRIIHSALADSEIAETTSEGEDPNRYVVIIPKGVEIVEDRYEDRRRGGDRNHSDRPRGDRPRDDRPRNFRSREDRPRVENTARPVAFDDGRIYEDQSISVAEDGRIYEDAKPSERAERPTSNVSRFNTGDEGARSHYENRDRDDNGNRGGYDRNRDDNGSRGGYDRNRGGNRYDNRDDRGERRYDDRKPREEAPEVPDGTVYRGLYTEPDNFVKAEVKKSGPPKFKSFGGTKKF